MNPLRPQVPTLSPLPIQFSLPKKGTNESRLWFVLRVALRVTAIAIMLISMIPAMIFGVTAKTLYKWSQDPT